MLEVKNDEKMKIFEKFKNDLEWFPMIKYDV